jgi:hypothetical protein
MFELISGPARRNCAVDGLGNSLLLNLRAATLNQNAKYDEKQHAGNNPNDRRSIHIDPPFLRVEITF